MRIRVSLEAHLSGNGSVNLNLWAQIILEAREAAGLTQRQLAELVGTKQPAIARLEDADYEGHTLSMLQRIADALGQRLLLRMEPKDEAA